MADEEMTEAPMTEAPIREAPMTDALMLDQQMVNEQMGDVEMEDADMDDAFFAELLVEAMARPDTPMPDEQMTTEQTAFGQTPNGETPDDQTQNGQTSTNGQTSENGQTPANVQTPANGQAPGGQEPDGQEPVYVSKRPPRWLHSTATQTGIQRLLHHSKLLEQVDYYGTCREEIRVFGPPETKVFLEGKRPAPPKGAATLANAPFHGKVVDSAEVNALHVPWNSLQIVQFKQATVLRHLLEDATPEEKILVTMPSAYETWKMEKEFSDLQAARDTYGRTLLEDKVERSHRRNLWTHGRYHRASLFCSRGYGSSLREVISIDEDWPELGWAGGGPILPTGDFISRFETKMRFRPVLVADKTTGIR